jgi:hypothetical protein
MMPVLLGLGLHEAADLSATQRAWLRKLPTCWQHVAATAKCWHIWPKCPCRGDKKLIRHSIFVSGIADILSFLLRVPEVHTEHSSVSSDMLVTFGRAERYMIFDNAKKIRLSHKKNDSRQLATYGVVMY